MERKNFANLFLKVSEMTEVGDSINRVETLIRETGQFEKLCMVDIDRAEEVIATGLQLIQVEFFCYFICTAQISLILPFLFCSFLHVV